MRCLSRSLVWFAGVAILLWSPIASATPIVVQAEDFDSRVDGTPTESGGGEHRWWIIDDEAVAVGTLTGATGPDLDFLQALTNPGQADSTGINRNDPGNGPTVDFEVVFSVTGIYDLDVRATGIGTSADSFWGEILGATVSDQEGLLLASGALLNPTTRDGTFVWDDTGLWNVSAGTHTIRIHMRESGTAIDALRVTLVPEPSTIVLVAIGLVGLAARARRR